VARSTFTTGTVSGHGVFDFIRAIRRHARPDFRGALRAKGAFVPKAVNLRRGTPVWSVLSAADGVGHRPVSCTCPADAMRGRMLSGMGVPDIRGGLGTGTFYTAGGRSRAKANRPFS
jgi:hypothetical protein